MEYLLLIIEFFYVKGLKSAIINIILPALLSVIVYCCSNQINYAANATSFQTNIVTVLGILIGFSISTLTLLLTVNHSNIEKAKNEKLNKKFLNKELTLYDSVQIGLAYLIIIQGFLLILNFVYPIFINSVTDTGKKLFSLSIAMLVHIILILMRNILDFYFILSKNRDGE